MSRFTLPTLRLSAPQSVPIDETGTPKIMDELAPPIKVELPRNEILDDKPHQPAPEKANLPRRQVRKE